MHRMRDAIAIILALFVVQPLGDAIRLGRIVHPRSAQSKSPKPNIQLAIRVTKQVSCSGNRDAYTEIFDVDTRYVNTGDKDITIYTGEDYSPTEKVANTLSDLQAGKYVSDSNWDVFFADDSDEHPIGSHPKLDPPKTLLPGQATESQTGFALVVRKKGTIVPMSILSGTYYVKLGVMTKIANDNPSGGAIPSPTEPHRYHWTYVLSDPIQVVLPSHPHLRDCDKRSKKVHP
jgi:hypothetical protein